MTRAIIFDFFDVIRTDPFKAWLKQHNFELSGPFLEASQQQDQGEITVDQFLARLSQLSGEPVTREGLEAGATVDMAVVDIIKALQGRYRLALLSNSPSALIRELLQQHDLTRYFDEIIVSSEVGLIKPSREIFELTLRRLNLPAAETIFIDDNPLHVEGARKVGIHGLRFTSAAQLKRDLAGLGINLPA
jgi:HAD superfamily hydrolase (TIGR01509 family)